MTPEQKKQIQKETVKKTLALLEKKKLLKKKTLKEGALPMAKSSSEAQQHYIELITNSLADNFDDIEDFANIIAALGKVKKVVLKAGFDWAKQTKEPDFHEMITAAEKDWQGQSYASFRQDDIDKFKKSM